jgi:DNA repair ATPase RecN
MHQDMLDQRNETIRKIRLELDFFVMTYKKLDEICASYQEKIQTPADCRNTIQDKVPKVLESDSKTKVAIQRVDEMHKMIQDLRNALDEYACLLEYDNNLVEIEEDENRLYIQQSLKQNVKIKCTWLRQSVGDLKNQCKNIWKTANAYNKDLTETNKEVNQVRMSGSNLEIDDFPNIDLSDLHQKIEAIEEPEVEIDHTINHYC